MSVVAIRYSRPVGALGATESLELQRHGESTLARTFNYDQRPEIGLWRHQLPVETFEQAASRLQASGYERLPESGPHVPGIAAEVFAEQHEGEAEPRQRAFLPPPPALRDVTRYLLEVMDELRAHPWRVFAGAAQWREPAGSPTQRVIAVSFANAGRAPLALANPLHGSASAWSGLRLVLAANGTEDSIDLTPAELRATTTGPGGAALQLAPGETFAFEVTVTLPVDKGTYQTRLQVHDLTSGRARPPERVTGTLWLDLGTLRITGARAR